jgi:hypothetical protein
MDPFDLNDVGEAVEMVLESITSPIGKKGTMRDCGICDIAVLGNTVEKTVNKSVFRDL